MIKAHTIEVDERVDEIDHRVVGDASHSPAHICGGTIEGISHTTGVGCCNNCGAQCQAELVSTPDDVIALV